MRNKEEPFADDPMLQQLHRIRFEHQKTTEGLSPAEYAQQVEQEARTLLKEHGFALKLDHDGQEVVCRVRRKRQAA